jgi:hypothetical protein
MRGGARDGAGRKAGARNKRTTTVIETARANGQLPHEFLCAISQGKEIDGHIPTFAERLEAAKAAAPFYAPKLANIDQNLSGYVGYIAVPVERRDSDAIPIPVSERDPLPTDWQAQGGRAPGNGHGKG